MKRKFINGLLALALLLPVAGGFTSCKDTDEDQFNNLKKEQYDLESKIKTLQETVGQLQQLQAACQENCKQMMQGMLAQYVLVNDFESYKQYVQSTYATLQDFTTLQATVGTIQTTINTINQTLATYGNRLTTAEQKIEAADVAIATINTTLGTVQQNIGNLQSTVATMGENLTNLTNKVGNIELTVNGIQTNLTNLTNQVNTLSTSLTTLTGTVTSLQQSVQPIINDWSTVKQQAYDAYAWVNTNATLVEKMDSTLNALTTIEIPAMKKDITDLQNDMDSIKNELTDLKRDIDTQINGKGGIIDCIRQNTNRIDQLRADLDKLTERVDKLVTGVILQGTVNPVFGSMALPFNVQSNMLIAYWGINDFGREYKFPVDRSAQEFDNEIVITDEDWDMLEAAGIKQFFTVNEGNLVDDAPGSAGRVYVTVNPNNVDFTGKVLPIVNSRDEESGIKLTPLRKSDEVLTFGFSRSEGAQNGFYEADAYLNAEDIEKVMVSIDDRLLPAMKEALQDRSKKDFGKLVKIIYDQFDGILPANGLKAAWTVNDQPFAVYSQYNLAATAYKPLSFKFMQGMSVRNLPTITPISGQQFNLDRFKIKVNMPSFTINTSGITFTPNVSFADITYDGKIEVTIEDYPVIEEKDGKWVVTGTKKETFTAEGVQELLNQINATMQQTANKMNAEMQTQFKNAINQLTTEIKAQVDEMMKKVEAQINGQISDLVNDIAKEVNNRLGSYINKANSLISKYNRAADIINNYLNNINNYLQVTMLVQGADGMLHHLSNSAKMPSQFVVDGGNGITLYLTTHTGEIAAPCLKKFVGVTNVFKGEASAQGGDAACLNELKAANATEFMNSALPGYQRRVAFEGKPGYVYELVYQGLDYHGYTSTRKFYVEVKEAEVAE